jgi:phosphoglycolate phosphatase-like HAD superfamily hydrolase
VKAPAFVFDLDGTLMDSVYQDVLAWREALEAAGIALVTAAERLGVDVIDTVVVGDSVRDLLAIHRGRALGVGVLSGGYGQEELERAGVYRGDPEPADVLRHLDEMGVQTSE